MTPEATEEEGLEEERRGLTHADGIRERRGELADTIPTMPGPCRNRLE